MPIRPGPKDGSYSGTVFRVSDGLQRAAEILKPVETLFDDIEARRVAEADCSVITKRCSRNHCHVCLAQQTIGKVLGGQAELADVHEHVKRTLRFHSGNVR